MNEKHKSSLKRCTKLSNLGKIEKLIKNIANSFEHEQHYFSPDLCQNCAEAVFSDSALVISNARSFCQWGKETSFHYI